MNEILERIGRRLVNELPHLAWSRPVALAGSEGRGRGVAETRNERRGPDGAKAESEGRQAGRIETVNSPPDPAAQNAGRRRIENGDSPAAPGLDEPGCPIRPQPNVRPGWTTDRPPEPGTDHPEQTRSTNSLAALSVLRIGELEQELKRQKRLILALQAGAEAAARYG